MRDRLSVAIVTPDILGPVKNGGIGTAYGHLAALLADAGHSVTILYTRGSQCESSPVGKWQAYYKERGISFVPAMPGNPPSVRGFLGDNLAAARNTYETLLQLPKFDVVHAPDWCGHTYFCQLAKKLGLAFRNTLFCITTHAPTLWVLEGNATPISTKAQLVRMATERHCIQLADILISPSAYMVDWLKSKQYPLPDEIHVRPNLMPLALETSLTSEHRPINELVFFGRLEKRKGLEVFIKALKRIKLPADTKITFLGKQTTWGSSHLAKLEKILKMSVSVHSDLDSDQAIAYLKGAPGRLAVLPSLSDNSPYTVLECLAHRIPMVVSDVGGIKELIHDEDQERVTFSPHSKFLAPMLEEALTSGFPIARMAHDLAENRRWWKSFHAKLELPPPPEPITDKPLVSVCIIHHERPGLVEHAIESIRRQTYDNLEVILVDDGSEGEDVTEYLDSLEPEFADKGWTIVRQPNLHAGAARNTAVRHAKGEYILFMDDDNCAKPFEVERFVLCALSSGADVLTCFADAFDCDHFPSDSDVLHRITPLGDDASLGLLINCFGDTNCFFKKSSFDRIGGFTEDYAVGREDHELFARAVLSGLTLMVVPDALVWYRSGEDRLSLANRFRAEGPLRVLRPYIDNTPPELHNLLRLAQGSSSPVGVDTDCLTWKIADGIRRRIIKIPGMERILLHIRNFFV